MPAHTSGTMNGCSTWKLRMIRPASSAATSRRRNHGCEAKFSITTPPACQPSTASNAKNPTDVAERDVPAVTEPREHGARFVEARRDGHAGGRSEPDHRAAEADGVSEEAPVVASLVERELRQRNVVEHGGQETQTQRREPRRIGQRLDRHQRCARDERHEKHRAAQGMGHHVPARPAHRPWRTGSRPTRRRRETES